MLSGRYHTYQVVVLFSLNRTGANAVISHAEDTLQHPGRCDVPQATLFPLPLGWIFVVLKLYPLGGESKYPREDFVLFLSRKQSPQGEDRLPHRRWGDLTRYGGKQSSVWYITPLERCSKPGYSAKGIDSSIKKTRLRTAVGEILPTPPFSGQVGHPSCSGALEL